MTDHPVVNLAALELRPHSHGDHFEARLGKITDPSEDKYLGASLVVVPAGKRTWPIHAHHGNDEMFVILEGEGTLRLGDDRYPVAAGDVARCPAGGAETAHQIVNTGTGDLKYIAFSSMREPDVVEYPESNKLGVFAGTAPGGARDARTIGIWVDFNEVGYWERESGED